MHKISGFAKALYLTGALRRIKISDRKSDLKIRWLHPVGLIVILVLCVASPFDAMVSANSIQSTWKEIFGYTVLW